MYSNMWEGEEGEKRKEVYLFPSPPPPHLPNPILVDIDLRLTQALPVAEFLVQEHQEDEAKCIFDRNFLSTPPPPTLSPRPRPLI